MKKGNECGCIRVIGPRMGGTRGEAREAMEMREGRRGRGEGALGKKCPKRVVFVRACVRGREIRCGWKRSLTEGKRYKGEG